MIAQTAISRASDTAIFHISLPLLVWRQHTSKKEDKVVELLTLNQAMGQQKNEYPDESMQRVCKLFACSQSISRDDFVFDLYHLLAERGNHATYALRSTSMIVLQVNADSISICAYHGSIRRHGTTLSFLFPERRFQNLVAFFSSPFFEFTKKL